MCFKRCLIDWRDCSDLSESERFYGRCGYRFEASKARGSSADILKDSVWPRVLERMTSQSPQNSQMIWRQAPQGGVSFSAAVKTAMASKPTLRSPSEMALKIAMRSAQMVRP